MPAREVDDVDIISHARAVGGGVVVAEDADLLELPARHLRHIGHQVVGDALGVFADEPRSVRAHGVEIAQQDDVPCVVCTEDVAQHEFLEVLARAVGVGRAADGALLGEGEVFGSAVDGRRRREDELLDAMRLHRFEEHKGAVEVVVVIFDGFLHALAHRFKPREVDDGVKRVLREDALHHGAVADVRIVKPDLFARDLLNAAERFFARIGKIVDDYDAVAALQKFHHGVAADVARAARYQNVLHTVLLKNA